MKLIKKVEITAVNGKLLSCHWISYLNAKKIRFQKAKKVHLLSSICMNIFFILITFIFIKLTFGICLFVFVVLDKKPLRSFKTVFFLLFIKKTMKKLDFRVAFHNLPCYFPGRLFGYDRIWVSHLNIWIITPVTINLL